MIKFVRGIHPDYLANVKKSRNIYTWNAWIIHLIFERKRALMMAHISDVLKASERLWLRYES